MAVCYFNGDYKTKYNCNYEIVDNSFIVNVTYPIEDEVESINGVQYFRADTTFADRDILVIDRENKINYLLKEAYYTGHSITYGHPDGDEVACFRSRVFLASQSFSFLMELKENPKTNKIRIESKAIIDAFGHPSVKMIHYDKEEAIHLSREKTEKVIEIANNNIKTLSIGDDWNSFYNGKSISVDITGHVDISLRKRVSIDEVPQYVNELLVFMQLYKPGKFVIDSVKILVDKQFCDLIVPCFEIKNSKRHVNPSVEKDMATFLTECYRKIPYRKSKTYIRNIPYIVIKSERGIEDTFLSYYRFIESYYKSSGIKGAKNTFIQMGIKNHSSKRTLSEDEQEKLIYEIISLRNQYVHSGYYLKNCCLKVKYPKIKNKKNPKDYTVNSIDVRWIYDRTIILKEIVIDIIFKEMLGFENYNYTIV